ncbi:hypothetical protein QOZ80_9AG0682840 [Eleusine coracana subsp. coracana]|nr:hypothetical protein QOZ80_9AG0682840 [Eleusine coracana subsp. coracana]
MKLSVSAFLSPVLLVLLLLLLPHSTSSVLPVNETDRMALLDFKLSCRDPRGSLASWNTSRHFCYWKGVSCSQKHPQRVILLDLTDQGLIGHISPSLGNLTYLRVLRLSNNSLTGEIPTSFGQLRRLERSIVHSDLKPSNILLGIDMTAHISDFGLARFLDIASTTSTVAVKGTIGYIAPEYATGGPLMTPGDVYSFGIVLLEMFIGRRPTDDMFKDGLSIVSFVEAWSTDHILEIVDAGLKEEINDFGDPNESMVTVVDCVQSVVRIGLSCTRRLPNERMNMIEVAQKLQALGMNMGDEALQVMP